jgi:hypothetical protein
MRDPVSGRRRKPAAVLALIDAITVRRYLKSRGLHVDGPVQMRPPHQGGTRTNDRKDQK